MKITKELKPKQAKAPNNNVIIENEKWYEFPDHMKLSFYLISDKGRLWSKRYIKFINGTLNPNNYLSTGVTNDDGVCHPAFLHRLVAQVLIPNPMKKKTVDHIDRNRTNNVVENLCWASSHEQALNQAKAKTISGGRQIDQYTLDGKYIKTWKSVQEAGRAMAGTKNLGQTISNACKGRKKTGYGYIWKYTPINDIDGEKWVQIPDIEGYYTSTEGRVKKGMGYDAELLEGTIQGQYRNVHIDHQFYAMHVLICRTFHGPKPNAKSEVNHINGNSLDNTSKNLEWLSHKDNMKHAVKSGLTNFKKIGETKQRKVCKYSIDDKFICEYPSVSIAGETEKIFGGHISAVCRQKTGHVTAGGFKWRYADMNYIENIQIV